jgi:hypothetical protein
MLFVHPIVCPRARTCSTRAENAAGFHLVGSPASLSGTHCGGGRRGQRGGAGRADEVGRVWPTPFLSERPTSLFYRGGASARGPHLPRVDHLELLALHELDDLRQAERAGALDPAWPRAHGARADLKKALAGVGAAHRPRHRHSCVTATGAGMCVRTCCPSARTHRWPAQRGREGGREGARTGRRVGDQHDGPQRARGL